MDEFESRLKGLPLRAPRKGLDHRVLAQRPRTVTALLRRGVPLWAVAAASAALALTGFLAGARWQRERVPQVAPITAHVVCDAPSGRNPFDFTSASTPLAVDAPTISIHGAQGG